MKALVFHKFKNICIKTILWTRNTNYFTTFVHRILKEIRPFKAVSIIKSHGHINVGFKERVSKKKKKNRSQLSAWQCVGPG